MGTCTSRTILFQPGKCSKGKGHSGGQIKPITSSGRLVRDELRKEVQYHFPHKIKQARDSLSLIQVPSKGVQQKNV